MKKYFRLTALLLMLMAGIYAAHAAGTVTATEVMDKAASAVTHAAGTTVRFKATGAWNGSGHVSMKGNMFCVSTSSLTVWYNGKTMAVADKKGKEVTLTDPTAAEASESNPMAYVRNWKRNFTAAFSRATSSKDVYNVVLTGKKDAPAKKIIATVDRRNFQPRKLVIKLKDGSQLTLKISSVSKQAFAAAAFNFPSASYSGWEINDLR